MKYLCLGYLDDTTLGEPAGVRGAAIMDRCFAYETSCARGGISWAASCSSPAQCGDAAISRRRRHGHGRPVRGNEGADRRDRVPGGARPQRGDPAHLAPSRRARWAVREIRPVDDLGEVIRASEARENA